MSQRRKRQDFLDARLERLPALEADNAEMQLINEALLRELEKRDQAIKEAVELICELEDKIDGIRLSTDCPRPHTPGSDHLSLNADDFLYLPGSPPLSAEGAALASNTEDDQVETPIVRTTGLTSTPTFDFLMTETRKAAPRTPSFIRDKKRSTKALRGLYLNNESFLNSNLSLVSLPRPASVFSGDGIQEEEEEDSYADRLSVLSESSFMSVYGKHKDLDQDRYDYEENVAQVDSPSAEQTEPPQNHAQDDARLQKWISERKKPSAPNRISTSRGPKDPFTSIGEVLHKLPDRPQIQHQRSLDQEYDDFSIYQHGHNLPKMPSLGGPIFGGDVLPPTPDTMSTHHKDANSSTPSIITEKSLLDGTPYSAKNISALVPEDHHYFSNDLDAFKVSNALNSGADNEVNNFEDDSESIQVEQSDAGILTSSQPFYHPSTFMAPSSKSRRPSETAIPTRPPLNTYVTDMMFNGEGYDDLQSSSQRTVSYPAPSTRIQRRPNKPPPLAYDAASARSAQLSPEGERGGGRDDVTPTKDGHAGNVSRSPSLQRTTSATTASDKSVHDPLLSTSSKSSSTRTKVPKEPPTPTPQGHAQTLASRIFRRSSTQTAQPKHPTFEHPASNHPARPLSFAMGKVRPLSGQYALQSPSRIARPSTAGSQTSSNNSAKRKESGIVDDMVAVGDETQVPPAEEGGKKGSVGRSTSLRSKMGLGRRRGKGD